MLNLSSKHVNKNAATAQIVDPIKPVPKAKKAAAEKVKTTEFETINPKSSGSQLAPASQSGYAPDTEVTPAIADSDDDDDDDDEDIPTLSPSAKRFSKLDPKNWDAAFKAISAEPTLLKDEVHDAILMEAFEAAIRGDARYAEQCVHQSLILSYCRKLGKDGVAMFFKRWVTIICSSPRLKLTM